jgi:N-formylglutamate amidohydrolase
VHNVQFFGQREEGVNAIQLELNESVYFDDEKDNYYEGSYNKKALEMMQKLIERTCLDIDPLLKK